MIIIIQIESAPNMQGTHKFGAHDSRALVGENPSPGTALIGLPFSQPFGLPFGLPFGRTLGSKISGSQICGQDFELDDGNGLVQSRSSKLPLLT